MDCVSYDPNGIYISGIAPDTTVDMIKNYFGTYGEVVCINLVQVRETHTHRRYAFLDFTNPEVVDRVLRKRYHIINGSLVQTQRAISKEEKSKLTEEELGAGKRLFVGGLPSDLTGEELRAFFQAHGNVTDARINRHGFVEFESEEVADEVLTKGPFNLKGKTVEVRPLPFANWVGNGSGGSGSGGSSAFDVPIDDDGFLDSPMWVWVFACALVVRTLILLVILLWLL